MSPTGASYMGEWPGQRSDGVCAIGGGPAEALSGALFLSLSYTRLAGRDLTFCSADLPSPSRPADAAAPHPQPRRPLPPPPRDSPPCSTAIAAMTVAEQIKDTAESVKEAVGLGHGAPTRRTNTSHEPMVHSLLRSY